MCHAGHDRSHRSSIVMWPVLSHGKIGPPARGLYASCCSRSSAVSGAWRHRGKVGYGILRNLIVNEYQGSLAPVKPNATSTTGSPAYPRISDVPDPVDLPVITATADLAVD